MPETQSNCRLLIYHHITKADQKLYGFVTEQEREMFTQLITINGVGPKLAVAALSGLPVSELRRAIVTGDVKLIASISGIGKTAERIALELRNRFSEGDQLGVCDRRRTGRRPSPTRRSARIASTERPADAAAKKIKAMAKSSRLKMSVEKIIRRALLR